MNLTLIIVLIYLVVICGIIIWTGKRTKTYKDFALGGGLPWGVVVGTMFASTVGGATMIGYVGSYKAYGLQWALVPLIYSGIAIPLIGYLVASRLRKMHQYTTADLLRIRFGKTSRVLAAVLNCIGEFAVVVSMMASFGTMVNSYLGVDYTLAMVIAIVLFIVTATTGGLKGVAWTDAFQAGIIFITVAVATFLSIGLLGDQGGFAAIPKDLWNPATGMPPVVLAGTILSLIGMGGVSQALFTQRVNACKTPGDAKKATVASGVLFLIFTIFGVGVIGISASVLAPETSGNGVVVAMLAKMPTIVGALYAAAIIAAILTTANSLVLSASMTFTRDIVSEFKKQSDKEKMVTSKLFIVVAVVLAFLLVKVTPDVMAWILITYTVLASIAFPLYAGFLSKKATPLSGTLSLALGGGVVIVWEALKLVGLLPAALNSWHSIFPGLAFAAVGFYLGYLSPKKSTPEQLRVVECFKRDEDYFEQGSDVEINA